MLKLSVKEYLKSVGDKFFVANPDYADWVDVDCLDVIIKRKPRWFWQKEIFTYDHFGLNDLLDSPFPSDKSKYLKKPEPLTPNFAYTSKHNISGKIGGKIASLISLDLTGDDVITLSIDVSGVVKQSIDFAAVAEILKTKTVDLNSNYIRHVAHKKSHIICLVTQYLYITKPTEIKVTVNLDFDETMSENKIKVNVSDSAVVHTNKVKSITFDAGTRLAFDFAECLINPNGTIELIDRSEGFHKHRIIPEPPESPYALPYLCAHITIDNQPFDTPDINQRGNTLVLNSQMSQIMKNNRGNNLTENLLILALEDKITLKQLELFLIDCQPDSTGAQATLDLSSLNIKNIESPYLLKLLKLIGFDNDSSETAMVSSKLNLELLDEILLLINSIYHLEVPYLQNLQHVLQNSDSKTIENLNSYLQQLKNPEFSGKSLYDGLVKNKIIKFLLMSVGDIGSSRVLNKYFEPTFILLKAS